MFYRFTKLRNLLKYVLLFSDISYFIKHTLSLWQI